MTLPEAWEHEGVWGDPETPDISVEAVPFFGVRESPVVTMDEIEAETGKRPSAGRVFWTADVPESTQLELHYRLDGGAWEAIATQGQPIPLGGVTTIQFRQTMRTELFEIEPEKTPVLTVFSLDEVVPFWAFWW